MYLFPGVPLIFGNVYRRFQVIKGFQVWVPLDPLVPLDLPHFNEMRERIEEMWDKANHVYSAETRIDPFKLLRHMIQTNVYNLTIK